MTHVPDELHFDDAAGQLEDPTLDTEYLADRKDAEASPSDLIDQALEIPLDDAERE